MDKHRNDIHSALDKYIAPDQIMNGEKIQQEWFPLINADIFISHSHTDENLAISLACWLYQNFRLTAFVDSFVWGYADELLKQIDDVFCKSDKDHLYDYTKRNYSTSHVHVMLMSALNKMIDNTECIFFLNTENSVLKKDEFTIETLSPWIYGEIEITRTIQKKEPERKKRIRTFSQGGRLITENVKVKYPISLGHLTELNNNMLQKWKNSVTQGKAALDKLYEIALNKQ